MLDLGFVGLLVVWSAGVGLGIIRRLGGAPKHPTDALALAVPLGLGALALGVLGLGELGWLDRTGLGVVLALGAVVALFVYARILIQVWNARRWIGTLRPVRPDGLGLAFDVALAATLVGTLLTALAPVTDGDALCYHLQVPKVFLWNGAVGFEPDLHETVYPLVVELLYAVALEFRGPIATRLIQWVFGLCFAASVTALARPMLGCRARWAGTVALLVPAVSNGMGAPLNDVALAAYGMSALYAWMCWHERPNLRTAALAGVLMGLAVGVKYPALVWAGLLGLAMIGVGIATRNQAQKIKQLLIFGMCAVLVGCCWYVRAYVHTGNPVHPFFRDHFGGSGLEEVLEPSWRPLDPTPWNLLRALGPLTLHPDRFDSFSHQFGPAFLLFLPALAWLRPPKRLVGLIALGYAFLMLCLTQRQSMRFVLICVGPLAVGVAWLALYWWERRSIAARCVVGALVLALAFESALALGRARTGLSVVLGRESAESYLDRREPTYRLGRWIDEHLPPSARLVGQDHRGFYIPRPYTMELAHRRRTGLGTRGESPEEIIQHFQEQGFTHVIFCPPIPETAVEFDPTLSRRLAPWVADRVPMFREELTDYDGVTRQYRIFELHDQAMTGVARRVEGVRQ